MKNNRHNCKLILEHDPLLKGVFRHNILTEQTDIVKPVWWERISPAFTDMDLNYIMLYLEETYGLTMDKIVQKSIVHQADRNKYHPVRNYLNSLQWDGQERIRYVLHHFLGAPVDELTYESMKMFLLGAIARAFRPGIKFEYMLCLVGGQGVGKVCSLMLFKEALDNPYIKPKKAETDRICEIMNTSIVGWKQGTMTRFKDYGTQRSWVCVNETQKT